MMDHVPGPHSPLLGAPSEVAHTPTPPIDWRALPPALKRELRASHVGEAVAVRLYDGVSDATGDAEARLFARKHKEVELTHLSRLRALVPEGEESRLVGLLSAGGWLMGWLPAKLGPHRFYTVLASVEQWVDGHYARQIDIARRHGAPDGLVRLLQACRNDEAHHAEDGWALAGKPDALARALAWIAVSSSRLGVALARRL
jgi:ubiquinone biosynthesis monooxygenase Coq7